MLRDTKGKKSLDGIRPEMSVQSHLFSAALIWCIVGTLLLLYGTKGLLGAGKNWLILLAVTAGTLKSVFVLDRTARKNIGRILLFGEKANILKVYSVKMWLLVLFMAVFGRLLRTSSLPTEVVRVIYAAIGWALMFSSRLFWRAWQRGGPS